jgi:putative FmdB family regulatory protein
MPLYEFVCKECKKEIEELCKWDEVIMCEKCEKPMTRQISKGSFQLKGNGWYKDHYGLKKSTDVKKN